MKAKAKAKQLKLMNALAFGTLLVLGAVLYSAKANAMTCAKDKWIEGETYKTGMTALYRGHNYQVLQNHTAMVGGNWVPTRYPILWKDLGECREGAAVSTAPAAMAPAAVAATQGPTAQSGAVTSAPLAFARPTQSSDEIIRTFGGGSVGTRTSRSGSKGGSQNRNDTCFPYPCLQPNNVQGLGIIPIR